MNVFMGYNPLVTKQAKVTVWVCEQDGETPVAPSNPSEGDCFVVYATDEAVLSNTPTSARTYSNGEWIDAEGGGGGGAIPEVTIANPSEGEEQGTYTSTVPFNEMVDTIANSPFSKNGERVYPLWLITPSAVGGEFMAAKRDDTGSGYVIILTFDNGFYVVLHEDGTYEMNDK